MPIGKGPGKDDIGKIFVGGLNIKTDSAGLQAYFEKFGEVTDCVLMTDPVTKRSRCFGFITYRDPSAVDKAVNARPHVLDNKTIDPKPAVPRGPGQTQPQQQRPGGGGRGGPQRGGGNPNNEFKVFVGGLAHSTSKEDLIEYFSVYGTVVDVNLMVDQETQKMRGFGFVTFDSKDGVAKAADEQYHTINGKRVEAKRAEHRDSKQRQGHGGGNPLAQPMHGMRGAGHPGFPGMEYGGYGQQGAIGMPGMGRGYGAAPGYGYAGAAPGAAAAYGGYGFGAGGMPMGAAAQGNGAGFPGAGFGAGALGGYGAAAGRDAVAAAYGGAAYGFGGAGGLPSAAAEYAQAGLPPSAAAIPGAAAAQSRGEVPGAGDFASYSAYGLGNYQQTDSQYGPTRGSFAAEPSYSAYPTAEPYGAAAGGFPAGDSFGRGGGAATRGFHPYGR